MNFKDIQKQIERNSGFIFKRNGEINLEVNKMMSKETDVLNELMLHHEDGKIIYLLKDKKKNMKKNIDTIMNNTNIENVQGTLHEFIVGILGTNKLNVPNIPYTYGYIKDNTILRQKVDGITFRHFIEGSTMEEFLTQYLQVIYTIKIANDKIHYTNYNLSIDNVLVGENKTGKSCESVKYEDKYLSSERLSYIVDHSKSIIIPKDIFYGNNEIDDILNFIHYDMDNILYDVFMFTIQCAIHVGNVKDVNDGKYNILFNFLSYFSDMFDIENFIDMNIYRIPHLTSDLNISEYLSRCDEIMKDIGIYDSVYEVGDMKDTVSDMNVTSFVDFYDIKIKFGRLKLRYIKDTIDYEKLKDNSVEELSNLKRKIEDELNLIHNISFTEELYKVTSYLDLFSQFLNVSSYAAYYYYDKDLMNELSNYAEFFINAYSKICEYTVVLYGEHRKYCNHSKYGKIYDKILLRMNKMRKITEYNDFPVIVDVINEKYYFVYS